MIVIKYKKILPNITIAPPVASNYSFFIFFESFSKTQMVKLEGLLHLEDIINLAHMLWINFTLSR